MIRSSKALSRAVGKRSFSEPVTHVYNPLDYAWEPHRIYLERFGGGGVEEGGGGGGKRVVFLGMNPGPWGMAQTGVPFGEVAAVRDFLGIEAVVKKPKREHPKRPIVGFDCERSEVSGRRLWGWIAERFGTAEAFFADHFVANDCPLVFMAESGKNVTPDKLKAGEAEALRAACDRHLRKTVELMRPEWLIGVGKYAEKRAVGLFGDAKKGEPGWGVKIGTILHPSPASPAANRGWAEQATGQMLAMGVW